MRSEEEGLELTRRKAQVMATRQRRRVAVGAGASAMIFAVAAFAALRADDGGQRVAATRPSTEPAAADPTVPPTSAMAAPSTTVATGDTVRTEPQRCPDGSIDFTVVLNGTSFDRGETVVITSTAVNRSGRDCAEPYSTMLDVVNARGESVYNWGASAVRAADAPPWKDGETRSATTEWSQTDINGAPVPADRYTARVSWYGTDSAGSFTYSDSASFELTGE